MSFLFDVGVEVKAQLAQWRETKFVGSCAFTGDRLAGDGHGDRVHQWNERHVVDQHLFGLLIKLRAFFPCGTFVSRSHQIIIGFDLVVMATTIVEDAIEV